MVQGLSSNFVVCTSVSWHHVGDCEASVHLENANCAYGENGEIPYQAGDGYIVCKHLYGANLRISALSLKA